ncbi:MAG: hypothetical protein ABIM85_04765 [candidate division WOR-3 bacterium]
MMLLRDWLYKYFRFRRYRYVWAFGKCVSGLFPRQCDLVVINNVPFRLELLFWYGGLWVIKDYYEVLQIPVDRLYELWNNGSELVWENESKFYLFWRDLLCLSDLFVFNDEYLPEK